MRGRLSVLLMLMVLGLVAVGVGVAASTSDESSDTIPEDAATATFAGGCFWCTEAAFDLTEGVYEAISGYTGGSVVDPTYEQVTSGTTGHAESVRVSYDPERISYNELLTIYWRTIDPTDGGGQLYDRGSQYRTVIYYRDDEQRTLAEASREAFMESGRFDEPIVTEVLEAELFYPAEEYHQDFYLKAPDYYEAYVAGSRRYPFLEAIWGDEPDDS
jgi:peptide methionine sulfoxide reductase msrA/msrB